MGEYYTGVGPKHVMWAQSYNSLVYAGAHIRVGQGKSNAPLASLWPPIHSKAKLTVTEGTGGGGHSPVALFGLRHLKPRVLFHGQQTEHPRSPTHSVASPAIVCSESHRLQLV